MKSLVNLLTFWKHEIQRVKKYSGKVAARLASFGNLKKAHGVPSVTGDGVEANRKEMKQIGEARITKHRTGMKEQRSERTQNYFRNASLPILHPKST